MAQDHLRLDDITPELRQWLDAYCAQLAAALPPKEELPQPHHTFASDFFPSICRQLAQRPGV